jgi:hypothetical protein
MICEKCEALSALIDGYRRERDEARASVADAYRHGAEAMREACARVVDAAEADGRQCVRVSVMADDIRALPIPEEP